MNFNTENSPNPAKLIHSLRFLGYDNNSALADICDNSWDAQATRVSVVIDGKKEELRIAIADDGVGMDLETLDQALRLGSLVERNTVSDLGKYGMGLVTASLSICRRTEVITRRKGGPLLYSVIDVDEIIKQNSFCKYLGTADAAAEAIFRTFGDMESGTVVILSKCDHVQSANTNIVARNLREHLGQVYRVFSASGKTLMINGQAIPAIDPLMIAEGAEIQSDEEHEIEYVDENGREDIEGLRVRVVLLPDFGQEGNRSRGINIKNQGFYVLRNYREVAAGETFGLLPRHNDYNRVRADLYFSAALDELMGVNFTKHQLKPKEVIIEKLKQVAEPQMKSLAKRVQSQRVRVEDSGVSHDEASRIIGQKANLLAKPKMNIEKRASPEPKEEKEAGEPSGTKARKNYRETQQKEVSLPCRFETVSMTASGPIYNAEPEGRSVLIQWNVDHPFYQRFILDNRDNLGMVSAADFLVYSLASAELMYSDLDQRVLLENIRNVLSTNMRTLLS